MSGQCCCLSAVSPLSFLVVKYWFAFFFFLLSPMHHISLVHIIAELQGFIPCSWVKYIRILKSCLSAHVGFLEKQNSNPTE